MTTAKGNAESRVIKEFEQEGKHVEVKVSYNLGGQNMFTYKTEKRGYYVHVQPCILRNMGGYVMRETTAFSGVKQLLIEVGRKSAKQLDAACEKVTDEMIEELLTHCKFN